MTALQNPANGSIIHATGRLETRLIAQGWTPTDQPATPGQRIITGADLDQLAGTLTTAVAASVADRADLRSIVEPMAVEVDELGQTIEPACVPPWLQATDPVAFAL